PPRSGETSVWRVSRDLRSSSLQCSWTTVALFLLSQSWQDRFTSLTISASELCLASSKMSRACCLLWPKVIRRTSCSLAPCGRSPRFHSRQEFTPFTPACRPRSFRRDDHPLHRQRRLSPRQVLRTGAV